MDAEDLLLREFLGIRGERARPSARRPGSAPSSAPTARGRTSTGARATCRRRSRPTGRCAWPATSPTTSTCATPPSSSASRAASAEARVFTHLWLALFGLWSWDACRRCRPRSCCCRRWFPLNIYDFACWARQTIVALSVVKAHRPCRPLPFDLDELERRAPRPPRGEPRAAPPGARGWLSRLDRVLRALRTPAAARRCAGSRSARAERWIVRRQEADGSWGGIQPPWVYSLIALHLLRLSARASGDAARPRGDRDASWSRTATTAHGVGAPPGPQPAPGSVPVARVGHGAGDDRARATPGCRASIPRSRAPGDWLLGEEVTVRGDWAVARPRLRSRRLGVRVRQRQLPRRRRHRRGRARAARASRPGATALARCPSSAPARWAEGMQSSDGGWGAFDADNTRALVRELPFLDFGEVIDEPSADVTAHALEMLARARARATAPRAQAGVRWLLEHQEPDGSWYGRWGVNHVYGTGAAVPGLIAAGDRSPRSACDPARGALAGAPPERGRRLGRGPALLRRRRAGSGAARAPPRRPRGRCSRCTRPASTREAMRAGRRLAGRHPARRRRLGRAAVHGHGLPVATTTSTTTSTGSCFPMMALGRCLARRSAAERAAGGPPPAGVPHRAAAPMRGRVAGGALRGGDGASGGRELPGRQPGAAAPRARAPARRVRLRAAGRRARRRARGRPAGGARLARGASSTRAYAGTRRAPAAGARSRRRCATCGAAARAVRAPDRGQPASTSASTATRPGSSCAATARCRPTRWASSCWASSARRRPSGSRCRTRSARRCSWPSTARTSPRTSPRARLPARGGPAALRRRGATTSPTPRDADAALRAVIAFEVARARGAARRARRWSAAARPRAARRRRVRRRRARGARRDRARRLRRARGRPPPARDARARPSARAGRGAAGRGGRERVSAERRARRGLRALRGDHPRAGRATSTTASVCSARAAPRDVRGLRVRPPRRRHRRRRRSPREREAPRCSTQAAARRACSTRSAPRAGERPA